MVKCEFVTVWKQFVDFLGESCTAFQCVFSGNRTQREGFMRCIALTRAGVAPHSPVERGERPFGADLGPVRFGLPSHVYICEEEEEK